MTKMTAKYGPVSCLLCGIQYRNITSHLRRRDHQNRDNEWYTYNVGNRKMSSLIAEYCAHKRLEQLKRMFMFSEYSTKDSV